MCHGFLPDLMGKMAGVSPPTVQRTPSDPGDGAGVYRAGGYEGTYGGDTDLPERA